VVLLSLDAPSGRTGGVVSVGVCALLQARERRSPLGGENRNELDADAGRYREARIKCADGYGEAEHRRPRVPDSCRCCQPPIDATGCEVVFSLAGRGPADYHRFSMIAPTANVKVSPAAIAAFAIIAPPAR
jgi:hypothetical protein